MDSGIFSGEEDHLNQQPNEQTKPPEACWCKGASLQDFMAHLKPSIGDEIEKALNRVVVPYLASLQQCVLPPKSSILPHQAEPSASRSLPLRLEFKGDVSDTLLTMTKIEDEGGLLEVELLDESGKRVVDPEHRVKIMIDALDGDFDVDKDWTEEYYNMKIAIPRYSKGSLLKGERKIELGGGVANVSHICFTDNSSSMRNGKFRLGARVVGGLRPGVVVKAAVTSVAFRVKERRLKRERKHKYPSTTDDLWRLVNIRKNGPVHERALKAGIRTVEDFLQRYHTNSKELQCILDVPEANWKAIVENARACKLTGEPRITFKGQPSQLDESLYDLQKEDRSEQADALELAAHPKQNELPKTYAITNQISDQELRNPSFIQGQEQPHQQQPPPPSVNCSVGECWRTPDAGNHSSNHMCSIPTKYVCHDTTAANQAYQGNPMEHWNDTQMLERWLSLDGIDWDWSCPQQEERGNVSGVSTRDNVTSKLIAACYVTKAAAMFMISVQQDAKVSKKRRRLQ